MAELGSRLPEDRATRDSQVRLAELPIPSTNLTSEVHLHHDGGDLTLSYQYQDERSRRRRRGGVVFKEVRAYKYRAETHCTEWHVEAYDSMVEVLESTWREDLEAVSLEDGSSYGKLHHFMIYIDSMGCYQVLARGWRFLRHRL